MFLSALRQRWQQCFQQQVWQTLKPTSYRSFFGISCSARKYVNSPILRWTVVGSAGGACLVLGVAVKWGDNETESESNAWRRLDSTRQEIRLLNLLPDPNFDSPVRLEVNIVSLADQPDYEAISYFWGDPKDTVPILMQDEARQITVSLHGALRRLRHIEETRTLWADALSIQQQDKSELNEQVRMMGTIFSRARKVNIWLGEDDEMTGPAFKSLRALAQGVSLATLTAQHGNWVFHPLIELNSIFGRPFFRRLWVIQEVMLAQDAEYICGRHRLPHVVMQKLARRRSRLKSAAEGISAYNPFLHE